jgi:hypothetical protein
MANLMQLATDDNNPDFVGARNPDDVLFVRFYVRPLQNNFQTEAQGRPIFDDIIFIEIQTPGNQLNIIDRPKMGNDERRFPKQWAYFQNTHSNDAGKQGTPFSAWPLMTPSQVEMLKAHKFHMIEQVAFGSDAAIANLGMSMGMAPYAFRERCKSYLDVAKDTNALVKKEEALKASEAKVADLEAKHKEEINALNTKLNAIIERMAQPQVAAQKEEKPARKKYVMTPEHKAKMKQAREARKASKG